MLCRASRGQLLEQNQKHLCLKTVVDAVVVCNDFPIG